jgi:hypothetical protein
MAYFGALALTLVLGLDQIGPPSAPPVLGHRVWRALHPHQILESETTFGLSNVRWGVGAKTAETILIRGLRQVFPFLHSFALAAPREYQACRKSLHPHVAGAAALTTFIGSSAPAAGKRALGCCTQQARICAAAQRCTATAGRRARQSGSVSHMAVAVLADVARRPIWLGSVRTTSEHSRVAAGSTARARL